MRNIVETIDDDIDPSSYEDPNDTDYEQQIEKTSKAMTRSKTTLRKVKSNSMSKEELIAALKVTQNKLTDVRKKRAEDRKDGRAEKQSRIRLQGKIKDLVRKNEELNEQCRELRRTNILQKDTFDNTLEEKREQFADAHEDLLAKATESTYPSLPDNVLQDLLHSLWARCRQWIRAWYNCHVTDESISFFQKIIARCASDRRGPVKEQMLEKLTSGGTTVLRAMGFAWLSREMILSFFESPFFACGSSKRLLDEFYKASKQSKSHGCKRNMSDNSRKPEEGVCLACRNPTSQSRDSRCTAT